MPRGNALRWLAGGEYRKTPVEPIDATASSPRTGPSPRIKKNVRKKEATFRAEQLVDAEVIKTPYGDKQGNPGDWILWFGSDAQLMTDAQYRANYDEVTP